MTFHVYFKRQRLTPVTLSIQCKQVLQTLIFDKWVYTPNKEGNESFNAEQCNHCKRVNNKFNKSYNLSLDLLQYRRENSAEYLYL